jgi:hypothetical protein
MAVFNVNHLCAQFNQRNGSVETGLIASADQGLAPERFIQIPRSGYPVGHPLRLPVGAFGPGYAGEEFGYTKRIDPADAWLPLQAANSDIAIFTHQAGNNNARDPTLGVGYEWDADGTRDFIYANMPAPAFGSVQMRNLSVACRMTMLKNNWLGDEWNVIPKPQLQGADITAVEVPDLTLVAILNLSKIAQNLVVAAALNFWIMNHHVGSPALATLLRKVLTQAGFNIPAPGAPGVAIIVKAIYDGVHAIDCRLILSMLQTSDLVGRYDINFGPLTMVTVDNSFDLRVESPPAGTHKVTCAWQGLHVLETCCLALAIPHTVQIAALRNANDLVIAMGPAAHQGRHYLLAHAVTTGRIAVVPAAFNQSGVGFTDVCAEIAVGVMIIEGSGSLARSNAIIGLAASCTNGAWRGLLNTARAKITTGFAAAHIDAMLDAVTTTGGNWGLVFVDPALIADRHAMRISANIFKAEQSYIINGVLPAGFVVVTRVAFGAAVVLDPAWNLIRAAAPNATV